MQILASSVAGFPSFPCQSPQDDWLDAPFFPWLYSEEMVRDFPGFENQQNLAITHLCYVSMLSDFLLLLLLLIRLFISEYSSEPPPFIKTPALVQALC